MTQVFRKLSALIIAAALSTALGLLLWGVCLQESYAEDQELGKICFDGDSDYDWAHFYSVGDKDATIGDLNITVLDKDGNVIPAENYDLSIQRTWWDEDEGKDKYEDITAPYGLADADKPDAGEGFTEFAVTAAGKAGTAYEGATAEGHFFITDEHSLNYVCAEISFEGTWKKDGWRMCDRFWVAPNDLDAPVVKTRSGKVLIAGTDFEVEYWTRVDKDLDSMDTDRDEVLAGETKLAGVPSEAGGYVVKISGKEPYYGGTTILLDAAEDDWTAELYAKAYYNQPVYSEPLFEEEYGNGDTLYLDPSQKVCVAFLTGDDNEEHGLMPFVGWHDTITDENGVIIKDEGDLSKLGFEVKSGTLQELGYTGKLTNDHGDALQDQYFVIEIDPDQLPLGTTGTLRYFLYPYSDDFQFSNEPSAKYTYALNVAVAQRIDFNNHNEKTDLPLYVNSTKTYSMTVPAAASQMGDVEFSAGAIGEGGFTPFIHLTAENGYKDAYASYDKATGKLTFSGAAIYSDKENYAALKQGSSHNLHVQAKIENDAGKLIAIGHCNCLIPEPCAAHKWNAGVVTKKATYTAAGVKTYTCTVCNATKAVSIAKLVKKANPMKIKAVTKTVKYSKVKKNAQVVSGAVKFTAKAKGTVTYKGVGTNAKSKKALTINKKNGKITVKKKTKKGTYKMKVTVKAAGTSTGSPQYKAAAKTLTVTIKVK